MKINRIDKVMEETSVDENSPDWILESLVAYLRGPVWITPIENFIEQKSVGKFDKKRKRNIRLHANIMIFYSSFRWTWRSRNGICPNSRTIP